MKKALLVLGSCIVFGLAVLIFIGSPIVIDLTPDHQIQSDTILHEKGEIIIPLKEFSFEEGDWSAYLFISNSDKKDLSEQMPNGSVFKTSDKVLLKEMQTGWRFIYTGGDVATVESSIIICHNGMPVFKSGIVLDKSMQGLQNRQYGWLDPTDSVSLTKYCSHFKRVYFPVVIFW